MFWTVPAGGDAVEIDLDEGAASVEMRHVKVFDFFNIPNGLLRFMNPVSVAAVCSFDIEWSGPVTNRSHVKDPKQGFEGDFILNQATMTWSARNDNGFTFVSNPHGTKSVFAQLGFEANGVFFGAGEGGKDED